MKGENFEMRHAGMLNALSLKRLGNFANVFDNKESPLLWRTFCSFSVYRITFFCQLINFCGALIL